ncbi:DMT family transporter [Spiribacter vilamensis]|uniref:EamA domain-containing membrane protein RarD n=1 Tax=Spiribacter vilamensis TaxID=531306 RepID=A0A4Q8D110_9GAMM|nr:DMT family transporter [Spiribacter vilamensis]RZU99036.1 EamA domain-containing membrane protein RarD [Spiribacter vilamensis]TVO61962.1 DMT family transporter [Spiribacter vilamensis]
MAVRTSGERFLPGGDHPRGLVLAAGAVLLISFDALLVRLADAPHWDIVFWRGTLIALTLALWMLVSGQRLHMPARRRDRWLIVLSVIMLSGNTTLFVLSITYTAAANTVVILAASPFFAALFSAIFLRERVPPRTWVAIVTAMAGVIVVFGGGMRGGTGLGDLFAMTLAVTVGGHLTLLRRFPAVPRLPLICLSGILAALTAVAFANPLSLSAQSYAVIGVMGVAQMPLATVMLAVATRYLPSPEVSLALLLETVLAPIWVWWALGEAVPRLTAVGGGLILMTVAAHSLLALKEEKT